jgi:hypothetical protein
MNFNFSRTIHFHYLLLFVALIATSSLIGQNPYKFQMEKLEAIDTISDRETISRYRKDALQGNGNFFLYSGSIQKHSGRFLFLRRGSAFTVFLLPIDAPGLGAWDVADNRKYMWIQTSQSGGSHHITWHTADLHIIDLKNPALFSFMTNYHSESSQGYGADQDSEMMEETCWLSIVFERNTFSVSSFEDYRGANYEEGSACSEDITDGVYEIRGNEVRKIKAYSKEKLRYTPMRWAGELCTGMTMNEVETLYPNAELKATQENTTCGDGDQNFQLFLNGEAVYQIGMMEGRIRRLGVLSPLVEVDGVHLGMTISELYLRFPEARLFIDDLSGWEVLSVPHLDVLLEFNTDKDNRVGIYPSMDDFATGVARPDARADFLRVG